MLYIFVLFCLCNTILQLLYVHAYSVPLKMQTSLIFFLYSCLTILFYIFFVNKNILHCQNFFFHNEQYTNVSKYVSIWKPLFGLNIVKIEKGGSYWCQWCLAMLSFGTYATLLLMGDADLDCCWFIFSSPEHKVLRVSYCDRPLSVVRRRASCVNFFT